MENIKKKHTRIKMTALLLLFLAVGITGYVVFAESRTVQKEIAEKIIRFHVLANSDSTEDQQLKLKVKEKTAQYVRTLLNNTDNVEEARGIIREHLDEIAETGEKTVSEEGYQYPVRAVLEPHYFPVRSYGDMTFPAGEYEALRVLIGRAEGRNWWCVMFPSLCFVDEACGTMPEESKEELKTVLSERDYDSLLSGGEKVVIRFRFLDWWNNLMKTG